MTNFVANLKTFNEGVLVGFVAFPVCYYIIKRFGAVLWEDVKKIAYKTWDLIKSKI